VGPARESRKTVTVVFCDVTGSTALGERLDPESLRRVMTRYFEAMRAVLERHGGTVEKFIGDAVMAVFGVPRVHEDEALRAVRAASERRGARAERNRGLERDWGVTIAARIAVNTGETMVGDRSVGQTLVTGDAVNTAARLEQAATPGEILLGAATYRLVREAVAAEAVEPVAAKGKAEPVRAFRLIEVEPEGAVSRRSDAPLVGRTRELRLVAAAHEHAVADRACHLVTILGVAGVGKSRLVAEALAAVSDGMVLTGRCLPYGDGITFWPLAEIVKQAAGITDADNVEEACAKVDALMRDEEDGAAIADRVSQLMGLSTAGCSLEEGFWAVRKLFEVLGRRRPLIVTVDDLQWAEPALLDLVEHLADWSRDAPIVLLCMARPEFLELRPGWGGGKVNAVSLLLEPLSASESEMLVESLVTGSKFPPVLRSRLLETCGGNPFFLEETLASLIEEGLLVRDGDDWRATVDPAALEVPPTIQALLAARLDRLGREELTVIEGASVVGQVFYRGAISELAPEGLRPDVGTYLLGLIRKDLVRPDHSTFAGQEAFRFRHLLIRDAAYQAMPKRTRAELHERFAGWLERTAGERVAEYQEVLGYHLEQAYRYSVELGALDEQARAMADQAARHLAVAGRRALNRSDFSAAVGLLGRSVELLPADDPLRLELLFDLAQALLDLGEFARVDPVLDETTDRARAAGDRALELRAEMVRTFRFDSTMAWEDRKEAAERAIPLFEELEDEFGLYLAHRLLGGVHWSQGRSAAAEEELVRVMEHANRAGAAREFPFLIHWMAGTQVWGPTPVEEGLRRCDALLTESGSSRLAEGSVLTARAALEAMIGRAEESRRTGARAQAMLEDLGGGVLSTMAAASRIGLAEEILGDLERAEANMRPAVETLFVMGERSYVSTLAGQLGRVLALAGNLDDAARFVQLGRETSPVDDWASQIAWRGAASLVMARRGDLDEAERLAREGVALTEGVDYLNQMADAWVDLAEVLRLAGRTEESGAALQEALALFKAKGNLVSAARTREALSKLT